MPGLDLQLWRVVVVASPEGRKVMSVMLYKRPGQGKCQRGLPNKMCEHVYISGWVGGGWRI